MKIYSNGQLLFPLVCLMLLSSVESFYWTVQPTNPTLATKGQDVSLTWQLNLTAEQLKSQNFYVITWKKLNQLSSNYDTIGAKTYLKANGRLSYDEPIAPHIMVDRNDSATLHINNVRREDEGTYKIEFSLQIDLTVVADHEVNVKVLERSEIVYMSNDQDVCEGSTVTLGCNATGIPVPNITWTRVWENGTDSEELPAGHGYYVIRNISRSSNGTTYRCTAYNGVGDPVNRTVEVTVRFPASEVKVVRSSNTVTEGYAYNLTCDAFGNPDLQFTWIKVSNDRHIDGNILNFTNIKRNDTGDYRCEASNRCGKKIRTEHINVFYKPDTVTLESNATENKNCSDLWVNFTCISSEANPPVYNYLLFGDNKTFSVNKSGTWIVNISKGGKVTYNCLAYQLVGNVSSENITLTVNVPPRIEKPIDKVVIEGDSLEVSCNVTGFPFPDPTVIKNGSETFHKNLLNITKITRAQAGEYKCTANNTCGTKSEVANIYVHYPPENVTLRANTTGNKVCTRDVVNFICTAQANPPVHTYLLYQNDTVIKNMTSSGKLIETMKTPGQLKFRCEANNAVEGIVRSNNTIVLTVEVPTAVAQVENKTVDEGENVTKECNFTEGNPPPTVFWENVKTRDVTPGKLLNITNITRFQKGEYRCFVNNTCGSSSTVMFINVQHEPKNVRLEIKPGNKVCLGSVVNFNCTAEANPPVHTYVLYENNTINNTERSGIWTKTMKTGGEFVFRCEANNSVRGIGKSSDTTLTVNVPAAVAQVEDKTVDEGENVTEECNFTAGNPLPTVFWENVRTGDVIPGKLLNFTNITRFQTGEYRCIVNNTCGSNSTVMFINVQHKPALDGRTVFIVNEGENASLPCPLVGNPQPNYTWYRENNSNDVIANNRTLVFPKAKITDSGWYTCFAENNLGNRPARVFLRVEKGKVKVPVVDEVGIRMKIREGNSSNINVTCKNGSDEACDKFAHCVGNEVTDCWNGSIVVDFVLKFSQKVVASEVLSVLKKAAKENKFGSLAVDPNSIKLISPSSSPSPSSTEPTSTKGTFTKGQECKETTLKKKNCEIKVTTVVTIAVAGGGGALVVTAIIVWRVQKKRKCRKDTRVGDSTPDVQPLSSHHSTLSEDNNYAKVNNGYAKSGPLPTGDNIDVEQPQGAAGAAAIPTYVVVDKSKKKDKKKDKKASEQKPPDDQYAAVDKSKKKKKNEPDATYAEVDMTKKSKKPQKHKPDEVLYADLGNFHQMKEMPQVSTSPKALPPIKRPEPYAETQYADITQFLKGNPENTGTDSPKEGATLPDSNSSQAPAAGSKEESSAGNTGEGAKANEETLF